MKTLFILAALVVALATPLRVSADTLTPRQIVVETAIQQGANINLALCIVQHESTFRPWVISPTHDFGLYQLHVFGDGSSLLDDTPFAGGDILDAWTNASAGAWLLAHGYAGRWSTLWECQ